MFNGCTTEVVYFLCKIHAYINLQQVSTDHQKAMLLLIYLKDGSPIVWFNAIECTSAYLLNDWKQLQEAFMARFQDPNLVKSSLTAIENLKQTGAAADYANKFQEHLVHLDLSMFTQITDFDCGLKPSLKLVLVNTPRPATLDDWIATVVEANNQLHKYEHEQKSLMKAAGMQPTPCNDHHASPVVTTQMTMQMVVPTAASSHSNIILMEIDTMRRGPIMAEEKEHHCKNGLCFYCSQGKHLTRNCPSMSKQAKKKVKASPA